VISNVLVIFLLLQSSVALAADSLDYYVHYLPPGKSCVVSGEQFRCFNFDETKLLLKFDRDMYALEMENEELSKINKDYVLILDKKDKQLELQYDNYIIMVSDRDRLSDKWSVTDMQLQSERASKEWWKSVAFWGTGTGVLIGVITGMIIHAAVN